MKETPEPPPVQPVPPPVAPPPMAPMAPEDQLQDIADRVGFVPNLRLSDNLIQLAALIAGALIIGAVGLVLKWGDRNTPMVGLGLGAVAGMLLGTFLSGIYLAIKNARRKS